MLTYSCCWLLSLRNDWGASKIDTYMPCGLFVLTVAEWNKLGKALKEICQNVELPKIFIMHLRSFVVAFVLVHFVRRWICSLLHSFVVFVRCCVYRCCISSLLYLFVVAFIRCCICSYLFVVAFVRCCVHSLLQSFVVAFIRCCIRSLLHSLVVASSCCCIRLLLCSFIRSFVPLFILWFIRSILTLFARYLIIQKILCMCQILYHLNMSYDVRAINQRILCTCQILYHFNMSFDVRATNGFRT